MTPTEAQRRANGILAMGNSSLSAGAEYALVIDFVRWVAQSPSPVHTQPTNVLKVARIVSDMLTARGLVDCEVGP